MTATLRPFQRRFVRSALRSGIDTAALSMPRGNGKSWLAAHLLTRGLTPDDVLHEPGSEYLLCAASLEQARLCYRFVRADLEPRGGYGFLDSLTRIGIVHKATNTRLRVLSSNGKTAMGIVGTPLLVADEPGSWEVAGGELMNDAIQTAQGKPGSRLRAVYIGTLAPARSGWWHDLIAEGSTGSQHVTALRGDRERWDRWPEIRRCNPLTAISAPFRKKLREERDKARIDSRLKARFLSYRLNLPSVDEADTLLTTADWERVLARDVPPADGACYAGVDLGGGRAWTTAVGAWESGRVEAVAVAPGEPSIAQQERRDRVPSGTYARLVDEGALLVDEGRRVPDPAILMARVRQWSPEVVCGDHYRADALLDAADGLPFVARPHGRPAMDADVRALRRAAADGPLAVSPCSRALLEASLAAALVKTDDQGSTRLVKRGSNGEARDDVAAALLLAVGLVERERATSAPVYHGSV